MRHSITTALLALSLLPAMASKAPAAPSAPSPQLTEEGLPEIKDSSDIKLSFYRPKTHPLSLVQSAREVTTPKVSWNEINLGGGWVTQSRDRFVIMNEVIAIQDFPEGLAEAQEMLQRLDEELSRSAAATAKEKPSRGQTTLRLSRMSPAEADVLISSTWPGVLTIGYTENLGLITLSGDADIVDQARALIGEADQPVPQLLLTWSLIEAVAPDQLVPGSEAPAEVARALQPLAPGKAFRRSDDFVVRGAAGGGAHLKIQSSVASIEGTTPKQPGDISISVNARGWESKSRQLHLKDCEIVIQRRMTQGTATTSTSDRLVTDLSIREGETNVIGSLGGDHLFVALTVTVME